MREIWRVLAGRERVTEPRDVRDVHEQRRFGELANDLLAEGVFPADVGGHPGLGRRARSAWVVDAQGEIAMGIATVFTIQWNPYGQIRRTDEVRLS